MSHPADISPQFADVLNASTRPIYAVDSRRRLVYCNTALSAWMGLAPERIIGRSVEYHSEPAAEGGRDLAAPLTDLCPPPAALAGTATSGTIGCVGRDGRLIHRRAEFIPLAAAGPSISGVLALLADSDLSPHEMAARLADEPTSDELHRIIRRFRRNQSTEYAIETLLGESPAMQKVRAQLAAAAGNTANILIRGPRGAGREHVARAIHYSAKDPAAALVPIDCSAASEEHLRRTLESLRAAGSSKQLHTLLLLDVEQLAAPLQKQLAAGLARGLPHTRVIATTRPRAADDAAPADTPQAAVDPHLLDAVSTMTIELAPLAQRLEDLPLLAQFFLESANRSAPKQVGSLRPDALDQLAIYCWPGNVEELRRVIEAAHAVATTHEITPADLPAVIHHAAQAAATPRRAPEKIDLDGLLESIEREVIARAMAQSRGNKSAAAELLGMNRPRLYRRLLQLGMISEPTIPMEEQA